MGTRFTFSNTHLSSKPPSPTPKSWDTDAKEARFPQFLLPAERSGSVWLTVGISEAKNELEAQTPVAHQNARVLWLCWVLLPAVVNLN